MPSSAAALRYQSPIPYTLSHLHPATSSLICSSSADLAARVVVNTSRLARTTSSHEEVRQQRRPCHRRSGHLQGVWDRGGGVVQEGRRRRSPCCLVDAPQPLRVVRLQEARQQRSGDPLGEQAEQAGARLQGACDPGPEAVGDGEGEAEPGRADPAGRRRGARVPAGVLGREGRAAGQGAAVLPLHHGGAHRRDALRLHPEGRVPERPPRHGGHGRVVVVAQGGQGRRRDGDGDGDGAGDLQGGGPAPEDRQGAAQRERRQAGGEVHPRRHRRRVRVLVHGIRQLPAVLQVHAAGRLGGGAASSMTSFLRGLMMRKEVVRRCLQ